MADKSDQSQKDKDKTGEPSKTSKEKDSQKDLLGYDSDDVAVTGRSKRARIDSSSDDEDVLELEATMGVIGGTLGNPRSVDTNISHASDDVVSVAMSASSQTSHHSRQSRDSQQSAPVVVNPTFTQPGDDAGDDDDSDKSDEDTAGTSKKKFQPKNRELWQHFKIIEDLQDKDRSRLIQCQVVDHRGKCITVLKSRTSSTSTMHHHLRSQHPEVLAKYKHDRLQLKKLHVRN